VATVLWYKNQELFENFFQVLFPDLFPRYFTMSRWQILHWNNLKIKNSHHGHRDFN